MRKIKFRVWETNKNKMNYGRHKDICLPIDSGVVSFWDEGQGWESEYSKDYIPMQFIGLLDKNGKEIYEGDILNKGYGFKPFVIKDIRLDTIKIARMIKFKQEHKNAVEIEVIGNIYENSELLNDK